MSNFYEAESEFDLRLGEFADRIGRIESHIRRGEARAARAQLSGMLDELQTLSDELSFPMNTIVVGAQLGFMSGGSILRGRLPAALIGGTAGWLYGQHSLQPKRRSIIELVERAAITAVALDHLELEKKDPAA